MLHFQVLCTIRSSETSVTPYHTAQNHTQEHSNLYIFPASWRREHHLVSLTTGTLGSIPARRVRLPTYLRLPVTAVVPPLGPSHQPDFGAEKRKKENFMTKFMLLSKYDQKRLILQRDYITGLQTEVRKFGFTTLQNIAPCLHLGPPLSYHRCGTCLPNRNYSLGLIIILAYFPYFENKVAVEPRFRRFWRKYVL
jgi:hypothetical protein